MIRNRRGRWDNDKHYDDDEEEEEEEYYANGGTCHDEDRSEP